MKPFFRFSLTVMGLILLAGNASAIMTPLSEPANPEPKTVKSSPLSGMTLQEFVHLSPKKYKELTGKKLNLPEKLAWKLTQHKFKRMIKKNPQMAIMPVPQDIDRSDFNILGFLLGIFLGPIGLLIAFLVEGEDSSLFKWALYGLIVWAAIVLLVIIF
jgi:hypothetical protein